MQKLLTAALCVALAMAAIGCGGVVDPSKNTVETFTGTVNVGPEITELHFFDSGNGEFSVRITALTPAVQFVGVGYGLAAGTGCNPIYEQLAQLNVAALTNRITSGRYCAYVVDPGGVLTGPTAYTMTVSHP